VTTKTGVTRAPAPAHTDMEAFPSLFASGALGDRRSADLKLAWLDAADDAHEAYLDWRDAERAAEGDAFVVYRAALDREEIAARNLQLHLSAAGARR
jgi:hypothetical protein